MNKHAPWIFLPFAVLSLIFFAGCDVDETGSAALTEGEGEAFSRPAEERGFPLPTGDLESVLGEIDPASLVEEELSAYSRLLTGAEARLPNPMRGSAPDAVVLGAAVPGAPASSANEGVRVLTQEEIEAADEDFADVARRWYEATKDKLPDVDREAAMERAKEIYEKAKESGKEKGTAVVGWMKEDIRNMRAWDYHAVKLDASDAERLTTELNLLGEEGWELVNSINRGSTVLFIFKRKRISYSGNVPVREMLRLMNVLDSSAN